MRLLLLCLVGLALGYTPLYPTENLFVFQYHSADCTGQPWHWKLVEMGVNTTDSRCSSSCISRSGVSSLYVCGSGIPSYYGLTRITVSSCPPYFPVYQAGLSTFYNTFSEIESFGPGCHYTGLEYLNVRSNSQTCEVEVCTDASCTSCTPSITANASSTMFSTTGMCLSGVDWILCDAPVLPLTNVIAPNYNFVFEQAPCASGCTNGDVGNGICNAACNVAECDYDCGFSCDCSIYPTTTISNYCPTTCTSAMLLNSVCDYECYYYGCNYYDNGLCLFTSTTWTSWTNWFTSTTLFGICDQADTSMLTTNELATFQSQASDLSHCLCDDNRGTVQNGRCVFGDTFSSTSMSTTALWSEVCDFLKVESYCITNTNLPDCFSQNWESTCNTYKLYFSFFGQTCDVDCSFGSMLIPTLLALLF